MTDKYTYMEGVDTSAEPAENEPSAGGILRNDGAAVEAQKTTEKPDQVHLMATRPNGGWKAWLQVACGFFLFFNTYGAIATDFKNKTLPVMSKRAD